jgi:hypothetical protein
MLLYEPTPYAPSLPITTAVRIRRYHFFPSSAVRDHSLATGHVAHLLSGKDEDTADGQLAALLAALRLIHADYFRRYDSERAAELSGSTSGVPATAQLPLHIAESVRTVRRRVLAGASILFSHVIPLHQQRHPEAHAAFRLAYTHAHLSHELAMRC